MSGYASATFYAASLMGIIFIVCRPLEFEMEPREQSRLGICTTGPRRYFLMRALPRGLLAGAARLVRRTLSIYLCARRSFASASFPALPPRFLADEGIYGHGYWRASA